MPCRSSCATGGVRRPCAGIASGAAGVGGDAGIGAVSWGSNNREAHALNLRRIHQRPEQDVKTCGFSREMSPDVVFLISDASFQWKEGGELGDVPWKEVEKIVKGPLQRTEGCVLNFVGFEMKPEDKGEVASIVRGTVGRFPRSNKRASLMRC